MIFQMPCPFCHGTGNAGLTNPGCRPCDSTGIILASKESTSKNVSAREEIERLKEALSAIRGCTYDTSDNVMRRIDEILQDAGFPWQSED